MTKFKINNFFPLTGRGEVLIGEILGGEISSGDLIQLSFEGSIVKLKIKSVEYVDSLSGVAEIGLILDQLPQNANLDFKKITGQTCSIFRD